MPTAQNISLRYGLRYVRALASAYRYMRDLADRDEVVRVVIDSTGSSEEPKQGEIDIKGFAQVIQVKADAGELSPPVPLAERFIDLQYLKAAGLQ